MWSRRRPKSASPRDDASTLLAFEVNSIELATRGRSLSARSLLNGLTLLIVAVLLAISAPLWIGSAQQMWTRLFPPPPYTGALLFTEDGTTLIARRVVDGDVQWRLPISNPNGYSVVRYGDTLYTAQSNGTETVEAIRAQDDHVLWQSTRQGYDQFWVLGIRGTQLYGWYQNGPTGKGRAVALDTRTGRTLWASPEQTGALGYLAGDDILICQSTGTNGQNNTYRLTDLDSSTGVQRWSHTPLIKQSDPSTGDNCFGTATLALLLPTSAQAGEIYAFDIHTGTQLWQAAVNGYAYLDGYDQNMVYVSTQPETSPAAGFLPKPSLYALRIADGSLAWSISGYYLAEATQTGIVLAQTPQGLAGIDIATGTVRWTWNPPSAIEAQNWSDAIGEGGVLYYADASGVYAFDGTTGHMLWKIISLRLTPSTTIISAMGQQVFLGDEQHLLALNAGTGALQWRVPVTGQTQLISSAASFSVTRNVVIGTMSGN